MTESKSILIRLPLFLNLTERALTDFTRAVKRASYNDSQPQNATMIQTVLLNEKLGQLKNVLTHLVIAINEEEVSNGVKVLLSSVLAKDKFWQYTEEIDGVIRSYEESKDEESWLLSKGRTQALQERVTTLLGLFCQTLPVNISFVNKDSKSNLELPTSDGWTALGLAASFQDPEPARQLIERGAEVDMARLNHLTPLLTAAKYNNPEVCEILLESGADIQANNRGWTALHYAVENSATRIVQRLIKQKADIEAKISRDGRRPIHLATAKGNEEIVSLLLAAGADPDTKYLRNHTALLLACSNGHFQIVQLLLSTGRVKVNWNDSDKGYTPLCAAAEVGDDKTFHLLLAQKSIDINLKASFGCSPLLLATKKGHNNIVRSLLASGADSNTMDLRQHTALMWAVDSGQEDVVEILLKTKGTKVDSTSMNGDTALHCAVWARRPGCIKLLLTIGRADTEIKNEQNLSPIDLATEQGYMEELEMLNKHRSQKLTLPFAKASGKGPATSSQTQDRSLGLREKLSNRFSRIGTIFNQNKDFKSSKEPTNSIQSTSDKAKQDRMKQLRSAMPMTRKEQLPINVEREKLRPYRYTSLPKGQHIRLLHIDSQDFSLANDTTQTVCRLETHSFSTCPSYACLSYTWGCPIDDLKYYSEFKQQREWLLEDRGRVFTIDIGRNLHDALKRITKMKSRPERIWIDALCICQTDLNERASQVRFMGDIYSRCERTIAWLGEAEDLGQDVAGFLDMHRIVVVALESYMRYNGNTSLKTGDWDDTNFKNRLGLDEESSRIDWKNYYNFYKDRIWFHRCWMYQEVAFSPSVSFLCGPHDLNWHLLGTVVAFLRVSGLQNTVFMDETGAEHVKLWHMQLEILEGIKQKCKDIGSASWHEEWAELARIEPRQSSYHFFFYCLRDVRRADATDLRDKVFGGLGFLNRNLRVGDTSKIVPDYKSTVQEIYIKAATILLNEISDLQLLSEVEDPSLRNLESLPSWVPDFSVKTVESLLAVGRPNYNASWRVRHQQLGSRYCKIKGNELILQGVMVDRVKTVQLLASFTEHASNPDGLKVFNMKTVGSWFSLLSTTASTSAYTESWLEVLWRTLIANRDEEEGFPTVDNDSFHNYLLETLVMINDDSFLADVDERILQGPCWPSKDSRQYLRDVLDRIKNDYFPNQIDFDRAGRVNASAVPFSTTCSRFSPNRRLFATHDGHLGLGPLSVLPGDQVWLIDGARTPFVLRLEPSGKTFKLIGEVYVHGAMYGPMFSKHRHNLGSVVIV